MALVAPISKSGKNWLIIYMVGLIGFGAYCIYDGFYNKTFMDEHTDEEGVADSTLLFNQKSPPLFFVGAALLGLRLFWIRNRRMVAEENELIVSERLRIPYDAIQEIDKTHFKEKGIFTVSYDNPDGKRVHRKFDDRKYDNMEAILDLLVEKIS
jgi:hypothetical protein